MRLLKTENAAAERKLLFLIRSILSSKVPALTVKFYNPEITLQRKQMGQISRSTIATGRALKILSSEKIEFEENAGDFKLPQPDKNILNGCCLKKINVYSEPHRKLEYAYKIFDESHGLNKLEVKFIYNQLKELSLTIENNFNSSCEKCEHVNDLFVSKLVTLNTKIETWVKHFNPLKQTTNLLILKDMTISYNKENKYLEDALSLKNKGYVLTAPQIKSLYKLWTKKFLVSENIKAELTKNLLHVTRVSEIDANIIITYLLNSWKQLFKEKCKENEINKSYFIAVENGRIRNFELNLFEKDKYFYSYYAFARKVSINGRVAFELPYIAGKKLYEQKNAFWGVFEFFEGVTSNNVPESLLEIGLTLWEPLTYKNTQDKERRNFLQALQLASNL